MGCEKMLSNSMNKKNRKKKKNKYIDEVNEKYIYTDNNDINVDEDEYEEYIIASDEEEPDVVVPEEDIEEEKPRKKRNTKINKIINIILVIILIIIFLVALDIILITKYQKVPMLAIPVKTYDDGGTKEYYGLGYKVIKYNQLQGRRDMELGSYKLKYNSEPTDLTSLDLSIEFNDNQDKTFIKYNKKFMRITGLLKEYKTKENKIIIGYIDEDGKYSIDIICNMASDKKELKRLELFKDTTVIGTITGFDEKTDTKTRTVYMNSCFAEQ